MAIFDLAKPKEVGPYDLMQEGASPALSEDAAVQRAGKYDYALGSDSPGFDAVHGELIAGMEDNIRQRAVFDKQIRLRKEKMKLLDRATAAGVPVTPENINTIMSLGEADTANPRTVLEKLYAEKLVADTSTPPKEDEDPQKYRTVQQVAEGHIAQQEIAKRTIEVLESKLEKQNTWDKVWNWGEQFVPGKSWLTWMTKDSESSLATGENIEQQFRRLRSLPPDQFEQEFNKVVSEIEVHNPNDAYDFATKFLKHTAFDEFLDTVFQVVDVATLAPVGALGKGGKAAAKVAGGGRASAGTLRTEGKATAKFLGKGEDIKTPPSTPGESIGEYSGTATGQLQGASPITDTMKDAIRANSEKDIRLDDFYVETGRADQGVVSNLLDRVETELNPDLYAREIKTITSKILSKLNGAVFLRRKGSLTNEAASRVEDTLARIGVSLEAAIKNPAQALRLVEEAQGKAFEVTTGRMKHDYTHLSDSVMDIGTDVKGFKNLRQDDPANLARTNEIQMWLGTQKGLPFSSREQASSTAELIYALSDKDFDIVRTGGDEWALVISRPVNETDPSLRGLLISTGNETPKGIIRSFLGKVMSADGIVSAFNRQNRHGALHANQQLLTFAKIAFDEVGQLNGQSLERLKRIMEANRAAGQRGKPGAYFSDVQEFEDAWLQAFGENPTEKEITGYFATIQLMDFDWILRNLQIYRDKSRLGVTNVNIGIIQPNTNKTVGVDLEGIVRDDLPWDKVEDADVYINDGVGGGFYGKKEIAKSADFRKQVKDLLESGYRVVEIHNPNARPLKDIAGIDDPVNFIISPDVRTSKLRWGEQLPYRPGYHVEYADEFWIKHPNLFRSGSSGRTLFTGDKAFTSFTTSKQRDKFLKILEDLRVKYLAEDKETWYNSVRAAGFPLDPKELDKLFMDKFDPNLPFFGVRSGENTWDSVKGEGVFKGAKNTLDSPYNTYEQVNKQFAQERDIELPSFQEGSEHRPVWDLKKTRYIDPLATLTRSINRIVRERAFEDYQIGSAQSWIEEFKSVIEGSTDRLHRNPVGALMQPMWKSGADPEMLAAAKHSREAIVTMLGQKSDLQRNIDGVFNKLVDSVYDQLGDKTADKVAPFKRFLQNDPAKWVRSLAFDLKIGLFNPIHLFIQSQQILTATAITGNPVRAMKSVGDAMLMQWLRWTDKPHMIEAMARKSMMGRKDFLESYQELRNSGWAEVGGDVAVRDDYFNSLHITNTGEKFLEKGRVLFNGAERYNRISAWNMAYMEFRKANPTKKIGAAERNWIITRADLMTGNMTAASKAAIQNGLMSVPLQFSSFSMRLAEQILGKRLTNAEKLRVLSMYSALYGLPTAAAAGAPLFNYSQDIKQEAVKRGYDLNEGVPELLMNGIIGVSIEAMFGKETNFSERYGPNQLPLFQNIFEDKSLLEVALGPPGSIIASILKNADPLLSEASDVLSDDPEALKMSFADFVPVAREVSSIDSIFKYYFATNLGVWLSKNESVQSDNVDGIDGFLALFGLSPREISDSFMLGKLTDKIKASQELASAGFIKEMQRMMRSSDPIERAAHRRQASAWLKVGGFRPDQRVNLMRRAYQSRTLVDQSRRNLIKASPDKRTMEKTLNEMAE